ncbi:MAG: PAS domain-containing protein, partial [bacterium]
MAWGGAKSKKEDPSVRAPSYQAYFEGAAEAVFVTFPNGRLQVANSRACTLLGFHPEDTAQQEFQRLIVNTVVD